MKKMLLATIVMSIMSTNAMAVWFEGKIDKINAIDNGRFVVQVKLNDGTMSPFKPLHLGMGNAAKKQMIAMILMAKASDMPVELNLVTLPAGDFWTRVVLP